MNRCWESLPNQSHCCGRRAKQWENAAVWMKPISSIPESSKRSPSLLVLYFNCACYCPPLSSINVDFQESKPTPCEPLSESIKTKIKLRTLAITMVEYRHRPIVIDYRCHHYSCWSRYRSPLFLFWSRAKKTKKAEEIPKTLDWSHCWSHPTSPSMQACLHYHY